MNLLPRSGRPGARWRNRWARTSAVVRWLLPLLVIRAASAHPLGQQSVDHYTQLNVTPRKLIAVYTLDMAEIATFQERTRIDANKDGDLDETEKSAYALARVREIATGLHLEVNGKTLALLPAEPKVFTQKGEADLPVMRLVAVLETPPGALAAALRGSGTQSGFFRDDNEPARLGWRQIGVSGMGTRIVDESVNGRAATMSTQGYAVTTGGNETDVRSLDFRFVLPGSAGPSPIPVAPRAAQPKPREANPLGALITSERLTTAKGLLLLLAAAGLGGLHALSPGHGKTLVASYLVGTRGTTRHALTLGLIVTVTHTAGVFALAVIILFATRYILPETLYPWLAVIAGLVVVQLGLFRLFSKGGESIPRAAGPVHEHGENRPDQGREHGHRHLPPRGEAVTGRSLLVLGISGGLVPCPSALVVLLSAVALRQIVFGLLLIGAFSVGLAGVLTAVGMTVIHTHHYLSSRDLLPGWVLRYLPKVGAAAIFFIGITIAVPGIVILAKRYGG